VRGLNDFSALKCLNVCDNAIGLGGAKAVGNIIVKRACGLVELRMSGNPLTRSGTVYLLKAMVSNRHIAYCDVKQSGGEDMAHFEYKEVKKKTKK
jgi:hypothetical protein